MEVKERGREEPFIHLNNESFIKTCALYSHLSTRFGGQNSLCYSSYLLRRIVCVTCASTRNGQERQVLQKATADALGGAAGRI